MIKTNISVKWIFNYNCTLCSIKLNTLPVFLNTFKSLLRRFWVCDNPKEFSNPSIALIIRDWNLFLQVLQGVVGRTAQQPDVPKLTVRFSEANRPVI